MTVLLYAADNPFLISVANCEKQQYNGSCKTISTIVQQQDTLKKRVRMFNRNNNSMKKTIPLILLAIAICSCSEDISVPPKIKDTSEQMPLGFSKDSIRFMDIMPNTTPDYDELARLKNYGKTNINLDDWRIVDNEGTKDEYSFRFSGTTIPGRDTLTIVNTSSKPFMRNEGDTLLLFNNKNELVDKIYWQNAENGKLYKHQ